MRITLRPNNVMQLKRTNTKAQSQVIYSISFFFSCRLLFTMFLRLFSHWNRRFGRTHRASWSGKNASDASFELYGLRFKYQVVDRFFFFKFSFSPYGPLRMCPIIDGKTSVLMIDSYAFRPIGLSFGPAHSHPDNQSFSRIARNPFAHKMNRT